MKVGELKNRIEELDISDDADVYIIQNLPFKDLIAYKSEYISKTFNGNLKIVTYDDGTTISSRDY